VTWGAAWWFIARDPGSTQSRRYNSGWIILALTVGIGYSGNRGWAQWSTFFEGRLQTNTAAGEFVPISPAYGFLWLFIAGVPWAGIGACLLAWCGSARTTKAWQWGVRIACGIGGAWLAALAFRHLPQVFLPLYDTFESQYQDLEANPNLRRLINDNRNAITHLGIYLGFLAYEIGRRDWKNVVLIVTVGLLNGIGWSVCQNWMWADDVWPDVAFNWWRCWESSGGISIGIAYGVAYYLVNRPVTDEERKRLGPLLTNARPNLERLGAYLGLILGLGLSIQNGLKGWANIYLGNEDLWEARFWSVIWPLILVCAVGTTILIAVRRLPKGYEGDVFPRAAWLIWAVLIVQNIIAQLVTGPHTNWSDITFSIYYVSLFLLTAGIVIHYQMKGARASRP
jgi:MFS family permease